MEKQLTRTSKFLSYVLRHRPDEIGLELDEHGWVSIDELLEAARQHGKPLDRATLMQVVQENDKQRFALSEDGTQIRANQGHSVDVQLDHDQKRPPQSLYHGTVSRSLPAIRRDGLQRGSRHHVHLSPNVETASAVGARRGRPVILTIEARRMHEAGYIFYLTPNQVWLTDHVPPQFIEFPADPADSPVP